MAHAEKCPVCNGKGEIIKEESFSTTTITPKQFKERMQSIHEEIDNPEEAHSKMDFLLCKVLTDLGYGEGIQIFDEQEMWYA